MFDWLKRMFASPQASPKMLHGWTREELTDQLKKLRAKYDAAITNDENRRHWANADYLSANSANTPEIRRILRSRSRYEIVQSNSYARGMISTLANDTIGTGPRLQMLTPNGVANRRIETSVGRWMKRIRFAEKLRIMRLAKAQDGESFAHLASNPLIPTTEVQLDLQLFEADQVETPTAMSLEAPWDGIEFDRFGNPTAYHLLNEHPGDRLSFGSEYRRIPAERIIHYFNADRPGQTRGIPEITTALPLFAQLRRYTLAVLQAAEIAADFSAVLETETAGDTEDVPTPFESLEIERGMMTTMPAGSKLKQMAAEQPVSTYEMFKREILNEIARCLNMPYNIAACNSSSYNYASGRLDHQTYYKAIRIEQSKIEEVILRRVLMAWFDEAVKIPGLLPSNVGPFEDWSYQWFWDGMEHVDPSKEASAQETRLKNHTTTLAAEYAKEGRDWEEMLIQRAKEVTLMQELGLSMSSPEDSEEEPEDESEVEENEDAVAVTD